MPAPPPLVVNRTFYVDSVTGNDANPGSQTDPWKTSARAFAERAKYGDLDANFVVHFVGAGPYTLPSLSNSTCGTNGSFQVRGDLTARTVHATGTFTGGINGSNVIGTSSGLGADTWAGKHIRVLTGALAGTVAMILEHTDTSVTIANAHAWSVASTANGNQFEIFTPGTELVVADTVWDMCLGGGFGGDAIVPVSTARHIIYHALLTGSSQFVARNSAVSLTCVSTHDVGVTPEGPLGIVAMGLSTDGSQLGVGAADSLTLYGAGASATGTDFWQWGSELDGTLAGTMYNDGWAYLYTAYRGGAASTYLTGIRTAGGVGTFGLGYTRFVANSRFRSKLEDYGVHGYACSTVEVFHPTRIDAVSESAVTAENLSRMQITQNDMTGGSTGTGLFGYECAHNGEIMFIGSGLPLLTGATAGQDIKVPGVAAEANAAFVAGHALKSTTTNAIALRI